MSANETLHRRHALVARIIELLEEYITLTAGEPVAAPRFPPRVLLVTPEPVVAAGFRSLLGSSDLRLEAVCPAITAALDSLGKLQPDLIILHSNSASLLDQVALLRRRSPESAVVLWVERISLAMAGRAVEAGVRGILPATCLSDRALEALHAISRGEMRLDLPSKPCLPVRPQVRLSKGQTKLLTLVGQGLKNKEIATLLGSTEGTVKTSLNRLFRALGVKDRLEAALYSLEVAGTESPIPEAADECELSEPNPAPFAVTRAPAYQIGAYGKTRT